jgi:putative ABC transport system permease protein
MGIIETFSRNVRHASRALRKSPGFTLAAVATLALGIGANTAIFSVAKAVMFTPLPYDRPEQLAMIWNAARPGDVTHLSLQEVVSYRDDSTTFAAVGAYIESNANLTGGDDPERVRSAVVTGELFATLGVTPLLGRPLTASDSAPGSAEVVVLGHGLWQRRFGGQPSVVGQTIIVNGRPREVVGVMPPAFQLPLDYLAARPTELWTPEVIDRARLGAWGDRSHIAVGRLTAASSAALATSEMKVIGERWIQSGFVRDLGDGGLFRSAVPVQELLTRGVRQALLVLLGAVGVVLLIACANVVNLLLAKADARRREVAVRGALGAGRLDIAGQLLTEGVVLAALSGVVGLVLARGAMQVLQALRPVGLPRVMDATLDPATMVFGAALALVTGCVFGALPSVQMSRQSFVSVLNDGTRGEATGRVRLGARRGLVMLQLASSVVLVIGAGLLLRSLIELQRVDLGFNPERVLTAQLQLPAGDYPDARQVVDFYRNLTERLEQLPGVTAAGAIRILPLSRAIGDWSITIEGRPAGPNENPNGDFQWTTPGYFEAMGLTMKRGRWLTSADREDAPPVVVISETMAARYWPGQDAIGKRFQMGGTGTTRPPMTIVGIVATLHHDAVVEEARAEMYLPHAQLASSVGNPARGMAIAIRTTGDAAALAAAVRGSVRALDRNLPVSDIQTMEDVTAAALAGPRFAAFLLGIFALLALSLAAVGTYAIISLLVSERSHEIGIRMALGAEPRTIVSAVFREGLSLAGGGIALGVVGALLLSNLLETLLYGVTSLDPLTFALVPAMLAVVALLASLLPARRAASLDPLDALRHR